MATRQQSHRGLTLIRSPRPSESSNRRTRRHAPITPTCFRSGLFKRRHRCRRIHTVQIHPVVRITSQPSGVMYVFATNADISVCPKGGADASASYVWLGNSKFLSPHWQRRLWWGSWLVRISLLWIFGPEDEEGKAEMKQGRAGLII